MDARYKDLVIGARNRETYSVVMMNYKFLLIKQSPSLNAKNARVR